MLETIKIDWELLGSKLATLSDDEQAKFFTGFALELNHFESRHQAELQLAFVNKKFNEKERKIMEDLFPMLWYKD